MSEARWVRVVLELPYPIQLADGLHGGTWIITDTTGRTSARLEFASDPNIDERLQQERQAQVLLADLNRILRLYRYHTGDAAVIELTLQSAGPFWFVDVATGAMWGPNDGRFHVLPARVSVDAVHEPEALSSQLRQELDDGYEPPVWRLLLLDTEVAIDEGRHREAVLLAWSAIESCFGTHYDRWVKEVPGLSGQEQAGLVGRDISLANQMTAGLAFTTGRSLHRLLGRDWAKRRTTYRTRNAIIHEGGSAGSAQAREALAFAQLVVETIEQLAADRSQDTADHA